LDQLERSNGLPSDKLRAARAALARAEKLSGKRRRDALTRLATQLTSDAGPAPRLVAGGQPIEPRGADQTKVRALATTVRDLASAVR
jgi:hypothetical protein